MAEAGTHRVAPTPVRSSRRLSGKTPWFIDDADHFLLPLSSTPRYRQTRPAPARRAIDGHYRDAVGPFFCCEALGACYTPAARGIAAGYDARKRAWRNW